MKDAVATMGALLPDDAGGRDAVHVAVFSATSSEKLYPGQDVALIDGSGQDAIVGRDGAHIGIVDPFLKTAVTPGARFWVYLYPRTITALAHRWSHPAFESTNTSYVTPNQKAVSEAWLRDFVSRSDCPDYETVLARAAEYVRGGDPSGWDDDGYLHFNGRDAHGEIPAEFWRHVEVIIGQNIEDGRQRPTYFSCGC